MNFGHQPQTSWVYLQRRAAAVRRKRFWSVDTATRSLCRCATDSESPVNEQEQEKWMCKLETLYCSTSTTKPHSNLSEFKATKHWGEANYCKRILLWENVWKNKAVAFCEGTRILLMVYTQLQSRGLKTRLYGCTLKCEMFRRGFVLETLVSFDLPGSCGAAALIPRDSVPFLSEERRESVWQFGSGNISAPTWRGRETTGSCDREIKHSWPCREPWQHRDRNTEAAPLL